jgi:chromatin structure-remodeling complex subunit RSC3/30
MACRAHLHIDADLIFDLLKQVEELAAVVECFTTDEVTCGMTGFWVHDVLTAVRALCANQDLELDRSVILELLRKNTRATVGLPPYVRYSDFMTYFTGSRLRWETLGIFFNSCGLSLFALSSRAPELKFVGSSERSKQELLYKLLEAADSCIAECHEANISGSDLDYWLMVDNLILASQVLGDAHYTVWRKLGDIAGIIFARGLHDDLVPPGTPIWLRELRNRGLAEAYSLDKVLSAFVGRPPRISKRYCDVKIPLDLDRSDLEMDEQALMKHCANLDPNGWRRGALVPHDSQSTGIRMLTMGQLVREDVLELCLGPYKGDLRETAELLSSKNRAVYASFPEWVQYKPGVSELNATPHPFLCLEKYLDNAYNEFVSTSLAIPRTLTNIAQMLQRVLVRRLHDDPAILVQTAHDMLSTVILARNIRSINQADAGVPWIVVLYGLPAAGVLAVELLHLNKKLVSHPRMKQNLCIFLSQLKGVHIPGEGNYALAYRCLDILQQVMDKVLAAEQAEPSAQPNMGAIGSSTDIETMGMGDPSIFDFSWFDQSHFDQTLWDGLNSIV